MTRHKSKILVVRVGRAGDLVMITPAVNALLAGMPHAELHLLTSAEGARVMRDYHPRLTRTWIYSRRFPRSLLLKPALTRAFVREGYERIFVLESKPTYRKWLKETGAPLHALDPAPQGRHYCDRCLDLVTTSLAQPLPQGWVHLPVTASGRDRARQLLRDHGVNDGDLLVGLHPTFSGSGLPFFRNRGEVGHRHWPSGHFARLARLLRDGAREQGRPLVVVVDALPQEQKFIQPLIDDAAGAVTLLCAPPDFQRYKALLEALDVLVTPNTGPMHIAAAVGTPVVALFSRWSAADCGPYTDSKRYRVLRAEDTDRPADGLAAVTPDLAAAAVWDLLDSAK
ncbi:hypothetical protein CO151_04310 [bacterium CG_4_9_14_3_um_filter_65_15]|nr:MAG: hypothetical protein CO151_04310 [bacterium CG_4_9_14_3_um_filter_65_15]